MIDTHSHLYGHEFDDDRDEVIERARQAGIESIVLANCDLESLGQIIETCDRYPGYCQPTIGLHPGNINENYRQELDLLKNKIKDFPFIAIGEIGLDLYWDKTFISEQIIAFEEQINWAIEYDLPIIIHVRDAFPEFHASMEKFKGKGLKGIVHCFSGNAEDAGKIFTYGDFYLGINGTVTYKKNPLAEELKKIGLERLVLETDAPYLSPVPYRGKRNESSYIPFVVEKLSDIFEVSNEKVIEITTKNAQNSFCRAK